MSIELEPYHLRTFSALSSNIAAGFALLALATKDVWVLTGDVAFAILFVLCC